MGTWSSRIGKFKKHDPNHGWLWKKIQGQFRKVRHWCCKAALCNFDTCKCDCHKRDIPNDCKNPKCGCKKGR